MNTDFIFMISLVLAVFLKKGQATIMCSRCESSKNQGCAIQAPPPVPCVSSGSGIPQSCSIVRVYKKDTGALDQFIRSCSISQIDKCFDSEPGYMTCANVCHTNGCNSAPSVTLTTSSIVFLSFCPVLFLLLI